MRAQRYKYKRHCATDCLHAHALGKWHVHFYYPMQHRNDHKWRGDNFYRMKHYSWWTTVHRWDWRYLYIDGEYDFSTEMYTKWRKAPQYDMYNRNHEY